MYSVNKGYWLWSILIYSSQFFYKSKISKVKSFFEKKMENTRWWDLEDNRIKHWMGMAMRNDWREQLLPNLYTTRIESNKMRKRGKITWETSLTGDEEVPPFSNQRT